MNRLFESTSGSCYNDLWQLRVCWLAKVIFWKSKNFVGSSKKPQVWKNCNRQIKTKKVLMTKCSLRSWVTAHQKLPLTPPTRGGQQRSNVSWLPPPPAGAALGWLQRVANGVELVPPQGGSTARSREADSYWAVTLHFFCPQLSLLLGTWLGMFGPTCIRILSNISNGFGKTQKLSTKHTNYDNRPSSLWVRLRRKINTRMDLEVEIVIVKYFPPLSICPLY